METTLLGVPDGSSISGFTTADGVSVAVDEVVHSIGDGWNTWCCGYVGQVLSDYESTSVPFTLNTPVDGFGFFAEPDPYAVLSITLTLSDGGSLTQPVDGYGGASFFGWAGRDVTGFTVSSATAFAVGDFFSANVPEPSTWAMALLGFAGLGFAGYRKRSALSLG
ncbi:MAG: PEP-CTERM sorting domain-containing protein [Solirubrobacterales bacterium]|nr:PEP-CTERM sorting domain-containing protein [Solirubrobacterales bacterium]